MDDDDKHNNRDAEATGNIKHAEPQAGRRFERVHKHFKGFTWSWFISPLAALGLSLVLANLPFRFHGLTAIGKSIYIYGVVQFCILTVFVTLRMVTKRGVFRRSIVKDSEAYFLSTVLMSFSALLQGAHSYAKPAAGSALSNCLWVWFWIYAAVAYCFALLMYCLLFTHKHHLKAADMTPAWMLPIFPVILTGPTAGTLAASFHPERAFPVLICGVLYQGLGILMSLCVTAIYIYRLFQSHFPVPDVRPSMFLAVGPPAYSGVGLLKMSAVIPSYSYFADHPNMVLPVQTIAFVTAVFFWMFALYLCSLAIAATLCGIRKMKFHLTWYSVVFPNCGLVIALLGIGAILECKPIQWVGTAATIVVASLWLLVTAFHVEALWKGRPLVMID